MALAPASVRPEPAPPFAFPTGLCAGTIALTGFALFLAATNVHWGLRDSSVDGLTRAWTYVNMALGIVWLGLWPAIALRERGSGRTFRPDPDPGRWRPLLEFLAILLGALPIAGVAAAVGWPASSEAGWRNIAQTAAVQGSLGLLAMGALAWRGRSAARLLAALLPTLAFALPIAAYIASEFYPLLDSRWQAFVPLLAIEHAARGDATAIFRWVVLIYAALGGALWAAAPLGRAPSRD